MIDETRFFPSRHIGPSDADIAEMLESLGVPSLEALIDETVPGEIRSRTPLRLPAARSEHALLNSLSKIASENQVFRSFIGMGYYDCITPPVIQRNVLENPGWYTAYTPYQPEIAQGRLEALLNFQTLVSDLTGLPLANASLLDEGTAAAEAMAMCRSLGKGKRFFASNLCHPQTLSVVETRARSLGIELEVGERPQGGELIGALFQYPDTRGRIRDLSSEIADVHSRGGLAVVATDLLALTVLRPPGEFGADIAVGSSQRFGVPMGFGGPHAAFLATKDEYRRQIPGRLIGVSHDAEGRRAYRMALQTREQHIRREKATSNICTAQVLLAVIASLYAVYHGPDGLKKIAQRIHALTSLLAAGLSRIGISPSREPFFDTLFVPLGSREKTERVLEAARSRRMNVRDYGAEGVGISFDETKTKEDVEELLNVFALGGAAPRLEVLLEELSPGFTPPHARTSAFLTQAVFDRHHSEHELLRYMRRLESRDLSLTHSMIPLGSCTMKLNGTSEMLPVTWPEFSRLHPFAPPSQARGYARLFQDLEGWLAEMTGFSAVSLQPNAGSQGEYAGLLAIRAYHKSRGDASRDVCLIPVSAHGTNPASAVTAGFRVVPVACDEAGNILLEDLRAKAKEHSGALGALMMTYPSTHGVFEEGIRKVCEVVHSHGGQVYMDGANMNAQVGVTRPSDIGADVCHLNLHKTFCIPHGGGGPGMGPIAVASHLAPFLPGRPGEGGVGAVSAAPYGSASILTISWVYIALMGGEGLRKATEVAILSANYMAARLKDSFPVLYKGSKGRVAHEFILDARKFKSAGIEAEDIAKRLMDYGFHAPTVSFPVAGTLMIEPTESESKAELDRFCEAMISIREEIRAIEEGKMDAVNNPLKRAPHTTRCLTEVNWDRPYTREQAVFPAPWLKEHKFWPSVARIDGAYGDRNLVCTCSPVEDY